MSFTEDELPQPKRIKGVVNTESHKKEKMKIAKREVKEYVNTRGNLVPGKASGPDCECRDKCTFKFSVEEKNNIILNLYSRKSKSEQETILIGLIERYDIKR